MAKQAFLVRDGLRSGSTLVINSSGSWVGNTITEVFGGTNQTSYTEGDILFASGANTLAKLAIASNGDVLTLAGGVPSWATPASAPNSFGFVDGDTGSVIADKTSDTVTITGGASITTSVTGSPAVLVITNDDPNVDQNLWLNFNADSGGPVAANTTTDTFTFTGGASITTVISGDVVTITNDDPNVDQNIWLTIAADVAGPVSANTTTDTLTLAGGTNIISTVSGDTVTFDWTGSLNDLSDVTVGSPTIGSILYNDGTTWIELARGTDGQVLTMGSPLLPIWETGTGQPDQNLWLNIAADSGGPVAANTTTDTLTLTGGTGIVSAIAGDTVTFTLAVDELSEKSGALVGTDRLTGTSGTTNFSETISGIPLSIFSNDSNFAADQNLFLNVLSDAGTAVADTTTDTLSILGGTGISTAVTADALTITNDDPNVDQNLWLNIAADSGGPVAANTITDTLTLTGGDGVDTTISGDAVTFDVDATVARMSAGSPVLTNVGTIRVDSVDLGVIGTFTTTTTTLVGSPQLEVSIASFATAKYRSAEYTVQAVQGNNFHTTKLLAIHDGTNADSTEFGTITFPSFFGSPAVGSPAISGEQATYRVDVNGGNLRLLAIPTTPSSTVFKVTAQLTTI